MLSELLLLFPYLLQSETSDSVYAGSDTDDSGSVYSLDERFKSLRTEISGNEEQVEVSTVELL